jgi:large subunit ribosomal protein L21
MKSFAVIKTGGKQYKVSEGDVIEVEKLKGKKVNFKEVLLVSDEKKSIKIGTPKVSKVKVEAKVVEPEVKAKKVTTVKFKPKKRYKKTVGHRQRYTKVKIEKIGVS